MKTNYYGVYDSVAEEFGPLFQAKNDGTAMRIFKRIVDTSEEKDKSCYKLIRKFTFDTESGQIDLFSDSYEVAVAQNEEKVE